MENRQPLPQGAFGEIGFGLRRPEELASRWRDRHLDPGRAPPRTVFAALFVTAVVGLAVYGLTMSAHLGWADMLMSAMKTPFAAGTAWAVTVPAFYVLASISGSKLDFSTLALAALITSSFGALAMLAGAPVTWFFSMALPTTIVRVIITLITFAGVGIAMSDVFLRTIRALEPDGPRGIPILWLMLICVIGSELMFLLDLFAL